jgi:hypothetical protein
MVMTGSAIHCRMGSEMTGGIRSRAGSAPSTGVGRCPREERPHFRYTDARQTCVCDTECFPNYWSIAFREVDGPRVVSFERTETQRLNIQAVLNIFRKWRVVTFNGINYDMLMIALALMGAKNTLLKRANDDIILGGLKYWQFEERYGAVMPEFVDHIDLMEVSPGSAQKTSLKLYAGRLHSRRMQDLPFDPSQRLSDEQIVQVRSYHGNDLDVTRDLYLELKSQIELRARMSERYGLDLRSKSDAQVAEAVIRTQIERRKGERVYKPDIVGGVFHYTAPRYIRFADRKLQVLLQAIQQAHFVVMADGSVRAPDVLEGAKVGIGDGVYRIGIGGLHSSEKRAVHLTDDEYVLIDRDVTSYYPNIILGSKLQPKHLGSFFLDVYKEIYQERLAAQSAGDKDAVETLKIVLNGSFGKFGSAFSVLYSPNLMIQTTITGQLAALMLIEHAEWAGFKVVSANTDGFVTRVPRARIREFEAIVKEWEARTGLPTKESEYAALYARDVNNYVAFKPNGEVKGKGVFAPAGPGLPGAAGMKKNPDGVIVIEAVTNYLRDGIPVERTIKGCTDIRKFVSIRRVKGGAQKDGKVLGKAVRWYRGVCEDGHISYCENGNKVPDSDGAIPCMDLPDEFPLDVDYEAYIHEAYATLEELGLDVDNPTYTGRFGVILARLPDQSTWHFVEVASGVARCGRESPSLRKPWIEASDVPADGRLCKGCRQRAAR